MASIKDSGDGKYRVFVCNGFKPDGKVNRHTETITAKSMADAKKQANAIEIDFKRGVIPNKNVANYLDVNPLTSNSCDYAPKTFYDLVQEWRSLKKSKLSEKTQERYEGMIKNSLIPAFGLKQLDAISSHQIDLFLKSLEEDGCRHDNKNGGYSEKSIREFYNLLNRLFSLAVVWKFASDNPCAPLDKPQVTEHEAKFYEDEQIDEMLACLEAEHTAVEQSIAQSRKFNYYYSKENAKVSITKRRIELLMRKVYVWISLASACRRSEVLGLQIEDCDFANGQILVRRVSLYSKESGIITKKYLKNKKTSKLISMPTEVMILIKSYYDQLMEFRVVMGDTCENNTRLFITLEGGKITPVGGPLHPDNISQWFDNFLIKYNLPKITLHEVRHTSISYLLNNDVSMETVSKRAGHKDIKVTSGIYSHVFKKTSRECADKFSPIFSKLEHNEDEGV